MEQAKSIYSLQRCILTSELIMFYGVIVLQLQDQKIGCLLNAGVTRMT